MWSSFPKKIPILVLSLSAFAIVAFFLFRFISTKAQSNTITNQAQIQYNLSDGTSATARSNIVSTTIGTGSSGNTRPRITKVNIYRYRSGSYISRIKFSVSWVDSGDRVKMYICKDRYITTHGCKNSTWTSWTTYTTKSPIVKNYYFPAHSLFNRTRYFYAFVCDDQGSCSRTTTSTYGRLTP